MSCTINIKENSVINGLKSILGKIMILILY